MAMQQMPQQKCYLRSPINAPADSHASSGRSPLTLHTPQETLQRLRPHLAGLIRLQIANRESKLTSGDHTAAGAGAISGRSSLAFLLPLGNPIVRAVILS